MASIQSLGVGSGLLTSDLVEDIIAAEREATDLRLDAKRAEFEAKISAFGSLQSQLDTLDSASAKLATSGSLLINSVSSTDDTIARATAGSTAAVGIHTMEVTSTARAHTLTSIRFDSADSIIGDGTLDFKFGTTTFSGGTYDTFTENPERASASVVIDPSNNTVDGVRDAINAANIGVRASVVDDGEGFLLVLVADQTGADHSMEITVTEGGTAGLSALSFNAAAALPGTNFSQSVEATDAQVKINGIDISRETNSIAGVVEGVTFEVLADSAGSEVTLTVNRDSGAITENLQAFVDAYNSVKILSDELAEFDTENNTAGLLTGDATIRTVMSQIRRFIGQSVPDVASSSIRALVDLGITTNQDLNFQLQLDAAKFESALAANQEDVLALLANQQRASDAQITFTSFTNETQAGSYVVDITQAASRGTYSGDTVAGLAGPIVIDADNDSISVVVDGISSNEVLLAQDTYADGAALATEMQSQINADAALVAAGRTVEVVYDSVNQQLQISSTQFGSTSNIGISAVDTNTTAQLGLSVVSASSHVGLNVAGTVNGLAGTGVGQFLTLPSGPQAASSGVYKADTVSTFDSLPFTIDANNDTFRLSVDGLLSNDIVLDSGSYASADSVAAEIEAKVNQDATLLAAGTAVSVSFNPANARFEIVSTSSGATSSVNLTYAEAGVVTDLGLKVATGEPGQNASANANPAAGIQLQVFGSSIGERGTVTMVRGVMNRLSSYLSEVSSFGGTLNNRLDGLETSVAEINAEALDFSTRMDLLEERLRIQFAAADALISTLNNTSSFLDQQLATLPGYKRDE